MTAIKGCISEYDIFLVERALLSQPTPHELLYTCFIYALFDTFQYCRVNVTPELSNTPSITKAYPPNFSDFERDHGEKRVPESRSIFANVKININCHCTMTQSDSKEEGKSVIVGH